jgi:plasmid replication initiation protein
LEQQVEQLSVQNQQFISQSDQLTTENKLIRQQLYVLREFISQAMSFAFSNIPANLLYQQLQHLSAQSVGQPAQQSLLSSSQQTSLTN